MSEEEARERLERMVAPAADPGLSTEDLDDLMLQAKRPDSEGRLPSDAEWVPTWDLDAAAATGWEWKAGRAAARYRIAQDGQMLAREQVRESCLAMAKMYRRGAGSTRVRSGTLGEYLDARAEAL